MKHLGLGCQIILREGVWTMRSVRHYWLVESPFPTVYRLVGRRLYQLRCLNIHHDSGKQTNIKTFRQTLSVKFLSPRCSLSLFQPLLTFGQGIEPNIIRNIRIKLKHQETKNTLNVFHQSASEAVRTVKNFASCVEHDNVSFKSCKLRVMADVEIA